MKKVKNQSLSASAKLITRALGVGIKAEIIGRAKPMTRRYSANGSTASPQKVVILNGIRMSAGQARQYITARKS
tara:strand:+ start:393 stop:614 length:222 start_codon:yes stop_codon:yes gene_type:complete